MTLIIAAAIVHIVIGWQKIVRSIKDKVQHILTLPEEPLPRFALIGKSLFRDMLLLPGRDIHQHDTIIEVFSILQVQKSRTIIYSRLTLRDCPHRFPLQVRSPKPVQRRDAHRICIEVNIARGIVFDDFRHIKARIRDAREPLHLDVEIMERLHVQMVQNTITMPVLGQCINLLRIVLAISIRKNMERNRHIPIVLEYRDHRSSHDGNEYIIYIVADMIVVHILRILINLL